MNEEITQPIVPSPKLGFRALLWSKIPVKIQNILLKFPESRFYKNKKIFWPITIAFSLIFLILILGLLFGKRNTIVTVNKIATPTPQVQATPQSTSNDPITMIEQSLVNFKNQIVTLDVKQSRLTPLVLNFNVKF